MQFILIKNFANFLPIFYESIDTSIMFMLYMNLTSCYCNFVSCQHCSFLFQDGINWGTEILTIVYDDFVNKQSMLEANPIQNYSKIRDY